MPDPVGWVKVEDKTDKLGILSRSMLSLLYL
jgi:hypothetical protein